MVVAAVCVQAEDGTESVLHEFCVHDEHAEGENTRPREPLNLVRARRERRDRTCERRKHDMVRRRANII